MAVELPGISMSFVAGADLTAAQYRFVKLHSVAGQVVLSGAGETAVGVAQDNAPAGRAINVMRGGRSKVQCNANISVGARVTANGDGLAVAATGGNHILGWAQEAGAAGRIITVVLADGSATV